MARVLARLVDRGWRPVLALALGVLVVGVYGSPGLVAWAASPSPSGGPTGENLDHLRTIISNITAWIVAILAVLATLFLTVGGVRYLMSGGDPGEVERAKTSLKSAAIGYGLAILAPLLLQILRQIVGAQ